MADIDSPCKITKKSPKAFYLAYFFCEGSEMVKYPVPNLSVCKKKATFAEYSDWHIITP